MQASESITYKDVVNAEHAITNAMKSGDVKQLDLLLHEDLLFNISGGHTITKDMDLETYREGKIKLYDITMIDQQINIIEDTAVVATTLEMKGSYLEQSFEGTFKIIRVWKYINNKFKVIAGSSTQM
ncbi:nuclear transport factor 2 family protein [Zhouia spongiae]|uniref:Nuclear transport factor 2 family protein n=1 Tax=Zhouia spongiae TaxID=2202721 RepID=A0ABY3YK01_9FLAO|nr:nuclear transport factor 2 family protein [Zhouia spongiae]UNY98060.1 nuclear transport factor 2 family protein [Zhouia spongiae]